MIHSKLHSKDTFAGYSEAIRKALTFLKETDVMSLSLGRHDIDGDRMFVNVMDMTTHPDGESYPEIHQKYIDLQYWPEGGEIIGVSRYLGTETLRQPRPEGDIDFLEDAENENFITFHADDFALFFPWDAHRCGIMLGSEPATSRKLVVKISMDLL